MRVRSGVALLWSVSVISKDELEEMFENMSLQSKWDMSKAKLWGYYFVHPERTALDDAALLLAARGYHIVDIYLSRKRDPREADRWWLHVEQVETHSPESLDERNRLLSRFADDQGLLAYDGMDVGLVPTQH